MAKSISQLDQITNEAIDLSQFLAIDDPAQTFKMSLLQLRDFFTGQLYPVGSTMFRLDNRTPNECGFPGTWSKVASDLSIRTAAADGSNVGVVGGTNAPAVPLPSHNHPGSTIWTDAVADHDHGATGSQDAHDHAITTYNAGSHSHPLQVSDDGDGGRGQPLWFMTGDGSSYGTSNIVAAGDHAHTGYADVRQPGVYVDVQPAGTHAHTGGVTVAAEGVAAPTLDVRGACINGNLWQRTA